MNYARGAWTVSHTGIIYYFDDYDVEDSYGSPDTSYDYILDNRNFVIEWDGSIDGLNDSDDPTVQTLRARFFPTLRLASQPFWRRQPRLRRRCQLFLRLSFLFRRTRSRIPTSLRIWSTRLVISTTAASMSIIPTGEKKSPYTSTVDRSGAWGVESDGGIVNGYNIVYVYSYGRIISPDTELFNMQYAWHVSQYGDTNVIDAVYDLSSYGYKTPVTNLDWNGEVAYFIGPPGSLGGFSNGVWDSYGVSPGVSDTNWTWMINLDGSGGGNDNVHGSYGIRRTVD